MQIPNAVLPKVVASPTVPAFYDALIEIRHLSWATFTKFSTRPRHMILIMHFAGALPPFAGFLGFFLKKRTSPRNRHQPRPAVKTKSVRSTLCDAFKVHPRL